MKKFLLGFLFLLLVENSFSTLVDGIVTVSWLPSEQTQAVDRFLTNQTRIQLKILCRESTSNVTITKELIKKKLYKLDKTIAQTNIKISGRIGRVTGCLPLEWESSFRSSSKNAKTINSNDLSSLYDQLWKRIEYKTFEAHQTDCDYSGTHLIIDQFSQLIGSEISMKQSKKKTKNRRETKNEEKSSPLANGLRFSQGTLLTWADGFYLIEITTPEITQPSENSAQLDVDLIVAMKNRHGGYLTADEYPSLIFYGVMCGIYALFALLWFICSAFYWRELLKIQFWIGGVILIGMIEKSAFIAEYDTLNRNGYKVHYAIVTAEVFSCLKRAVSRMLVIIVALGYGIVKPRLGPLKQKILAIGILYFIVATSESIFRLNTKNDETNNKVLLLRIPLAIVDAIIYYWIFTGLMATTRILRLKNNTVKLAVYQKFTNTILFSILVSVLFMIWSLKSHLFTSCITNWNDFWIDDAFWHILFSLILLVIMFLFRPSNNNQRYAFVPLLDQSDNERHEFSDSDNERGENALFDSITMRKTMVNEIGTSTKQKKMSHQGSMNRDENETIDDTLTWVENNIPTSIADHALQALDGEEEIVNTKLERSKMQ